MTLALLTAFLFGCAAYPAKRLAEDGWSEYSLLFVNFAIGFVPLLGATLLWGEWTFSDDFWLAFPVVIVGNLIAVTSYYRAMKMSELSIVMPLVSLSPVFMIVTSRIIVNESLSNAGVAGVVLVVAGAYFLGCSKDRGTLMAPFRALLRDKGAQWALLVSFIWSITANFDKVCVLNSNPLAYPTLFSIVMAFVSVPILWRVNRFQEIRNLRADPNINVAVLGLLYGSMLACQMSAVAVMAVPYVIAIKRAGLLVGVIVGIARKEDGLFWRILGSLFVLSGVCVILIWGR
ncbi:MAG: EamA family transporter [Candidatus Lindowbacteria bacterium]|nr:EamA family transporter [Candidatus Lindowbacteria bacterium]